MQTLSEVEQSCYPLSNVNKMAYITQVNTQVINQISYIHTNSSVKKESRADGSLEVYYSRGEDYNIRIADSEMISPSSYSFRMP